MIAFRDGYKYQLAETYALVVPVCPSVGVGNQWIDLTPQGMLTIQRGYAWDGPSGPTIDSPCFMRGSLVHDALYQIMRESLIPETYREVADRTLQRICREDGMTRLRAWWVYQGVRWGGHPAADPRYERPLITAP